jgi:hypothetical protein
MQQIEWDGESNDLIGIVPLFGDPEGRPEANAACHEVIEHRVCTLLDQGSLETERQIAEPQTQQFAIWELV